jgi:hypothetical protein
MRKISYHALVTPTKVGIQLDPQSRLLVFYMFCMHFDERDFASSRLRVSQKLWGTRRREDAKGGDSSMNVEEISYIVVDTAFHLHRE